MNLRLSFIIMASLLGSFEVNGQLPITKKAGYVNGKKIKNGGVQFAYLDQVLGFYEGGIIITRFEGKKNYLEKLDTTDMSVAKSVRLSDLSYDQYKIDYKEAFILNNRLYLRFEYRKSKPVRSQHEIFYEYDLKTLSQKSVVTERKTLYVAPEAVQVYTRGAYFGKVSHTARQLVERGLAMSNNESHLICYTSSITNDNKKSVTFDMYNSSMRHTGHDSIVFGYHWEKFDMEDILVGNDGTVYVLGVEYFNKKDDKREDQRYIYHLFVYFKESGQIKDVSITLPGNLISDIRIDFNSNNELLIVGFYGKENVRSITGVFSSKFDLKTRSLGFVNKQDFSMEFLTEGMNEKDKANAAKKKIGGETIDIDHFRMDALIPCQDGSSLLTGEQYYVRSHRASDGSRFSTVFCKDIVVVKINPDGQIKWAHRIPKRQKASNGDAISYAITSCHKNMYIFFNDNEKNFENKKGEPELYKSMGPMAMIELKPDGSYTKEVLFEHSIMYPVYSCGYEDCKMLMYHWNGSYFKFLLVNIK